MQDQLDGYGVVFNPEDQRRHWQHIQAAMREHERLESLPRPALKQEPWKDKPAGHYEKGSGI